MENRKGFSVLVVLFVLAPIFISLAPAAQTLQQIKTRMLKRLPVILELKTQGVVGENNHGYLEFRGGKRPHRDIVEAENRDRRKVYEIISRQQGVPITTVERLRARQIAERALPGHWLQDANGHWYRKK